MTRRRTPATIGGCLRSEAPVSVDLPCPVCGALNRRTFRIEALQVRRLKHKARATPECVFVCPECGDALVLALLPARGAGI